MPIFISYSHQDADFVEKLARQLVRQKLYIWLDKWELNVGDSLIQRIQKAIDTAPGLIVVLSKASVASEWCKKELEGGLVRELEEKRVVVFPVVLEDCELPLFLRGKLFADFRKSFDEGLSTLVQSIARVSSADQGRVEVPDFHIDWAVDWHLNPRHTGMQVVLLEHSPLLPYSCFTDVTFPLEGPVAEWFRQEHSADRGETARAELLAVLAEKLAKVPDLRFRLKNQSPQTMTTECIDVNRGFKFVVRVSCRWLGQDTGRDILVDVGAQLQGISGQLTKIIKPRKVPNSL